MASFWEETTREWLGWGEVFALCQPVSKAGLRYKREVQPYLPAERTAWQEAMSDWQALQKVLCDGSFAKAIGDALREVPDAAALLGLLEQGASLRQVDFYEIKSLLWQGRQVERLLQEHGLRYAWWVSPDWETLLRLLNPPGELVPTFSLAEHPDHVLTRLRGELAQIESRLFRRKQEQVDALRARYGRVPNRSGELIWEKTERGRIAKAQEDPALALRQENVFEAVFAVVEPPELQGWRQEQEELRTAVEDREVLILQELVRKLKPHAQTLQAVLTALARLDWTLAKAVLARKWQGDVDAQVIEWLDSDDAPWQVTSGWHPTARASVEKRGGTFTPLDLTLHPGVGLITGPNMGGKTVALKTFALLQALAQHAMPVPAQRFFFHPVERIGSSGGDEQSLESGLSSFGAEMYRLADLLATQGRALLLLDEVARTTNPQEGEALAYGLAKHLLTTKHTALLASHFPGVARVQGLQTYRVAGLRREVLAELERRADIREVLSQLHRAMDYRLMPCVAGDVPRDALRLAQSFGLPEGLLRAAADANARQE
ncbi:MAG TPA: hypothetical protein VFV52_02405 [Bacilli bacterium]|nr:hypothetical protein [Bacilli bacterium]